MQIKKILKFLNILGVKSFDDEEKLKLILDDKYPIGETEYPKAKITDIYMFLKMFKTNPLFHIY